MLTEELALKLQMELIDPLYSDLLATTSISIGTTFPAGQLPNLITHTQVVNRFGTIIQLWTVVLYNEACKEYTAFATVKSSLV